jgi:hypothetical protein
MQRDHFMRHVIFTLFIVAGALLLVGCPARWKAVFINGTEQPIQVTVFESHRGSNSFTIASGNSHTAMFSTVYRFIVSDAKGTQLFERTRPGFGFSDVPAEYPHMYILLTTTNAYAIPREYRNNWRVHINKITKPR